MRITMGHHPRSRWVIVQNAYTLRRHFEQAKAVRKETAALKIKAAVSNGRVDMAAVRRLFFFCRRVAVSKST